MTNKNIMTIIGGIIAVSLLVMLPVVAEAYYFTIYSHNNFEPHLEVSGKVDFTPSYDSGLDILTITFGVNPGMDARNELVELKFYAVNPTNPNNLFYLSTETFTYSDGIAVQTPNDKPSGTVIHMEIKEATEGEIPVGFPHMSWRFNLTWTPADVGGYLEEEEEEEVVFSEETNTIKSFGRCSDCTPPTLGLDSDQIIVVDNGFSYNGNSVQVEKWHTPYPLITAKIGEINKVEIVVYENKGINNMDLIQFGLGVTEFGQSLNGLEVLIEVHLQTFGTTNDIEVEKVIIKDRDNLIDKNSVYAVADIIKCQNILVSPNCVKITLAYSYLEATLNNMMLVNVQDKSHNSQNFYFNEGVQVVGESLNEPPTYIMQNKHNSQQKEDLTLTLTRTDKVNKIWEDTNGVEYLKVSSDRFDRITPPTPIECNDKPLSEVNVPTRNNCHFRALTEIWIGTK